MQYLGKLFADIRRSVATVYKNAYSSDNKKKRIHYSVRFNWYVNALSISEMR